MNKFYLLYSFCILFFLASCLRPVSTVPISTLEEIEPEEKTVTPESKIEAREYFGQRLAPLTPQNILDIEHITTLGDGFILGTALSSDLKTLAIRTGKGVYLYDSSTLEQNTFIDTSEAPDYSKWHWIDTKPLAFSADGNYLAFSIDERVYIWDTLANRRLQDSRPIGTIPDWEPVSIEFNKDSDRVLVITEGFLTNCDGVGANLALYEFDGTLLFDRYSCGRPHNNYYRFTLDNKLYLFLNNIHPLAQPNEVYIFDVIEGTLLESSIINITEWMNDLDHVNFLNSEAFYYDVAPDGSLLASLAFENETLFTKIIDTKTREVITTANGRIEFVSAETGDYTWQEKISTSPYLSEVCDFQTPNLRVDAYKQITSNQAISILEFTRQNKLVDIELWSLESCKLIDELNFIATESPVFSPDGKWLAINNGFDVVVLHAETGEIHFRIPGISNEAPLDILVFNQDGSKLIASTLGRDNFSPTQFYADYKLQVWDVSLGEIKHVITPSTSYLKDLVITPYPEILITRDSEQVSVWNIETGEFLSSLPDGDFVFAEDKTIWLTNDGDLFRYELPSGDAVQWVFHTYFSIDQMVINDSKTLIFARTRQIDDGKAFFTTFDASTGEVLHEVDSLNRYLVTSLDDAILLRRISCDKISVIDFQLNQIVPTIPCYRNLSISPNNILGFVDERSLQFWDLTNGSYLGAIQLNKFNPKVTFSPDGYLIAITGKDGLVELWGVPKE